MDWRWRPEVTLPLALAVVAYASGWARLAHRSPAGHRRALVRRLVLSLAGLVVLAVALLGLHDAAHERFLPHMIQHLLLMMVAVACAPFFGPALRRSAAVSTVVM